MLKDKASWWYISHGAMKSKCDDHTRIDHHHHMYVRKHRRDSHRIYSSFRFLYSLPNVARSSESKAYSRKEAETVTGQSLEGGAADI